MLSLRIASTDPPWSRQVSDSPAKSQIHTCRTGVAIPAETASGVLAQVGAEVRDGEGDPAALAGVDEPLLQQGVPGG